MEDADKQAVDVKTSLEEWFIGAKTVVVAGIGNPFRRDDFVGVEVVHKLKNRVSKDVFLIEAETVPESFMHKITEIKPTHILLIDAAMINQKPGTTKLVDTKQLIKTSAISTHTLPLRIFCDYLTETTKAKITLLAIQPLDTSFGEGLTPTLKKTAAELAKVLQKILSQPH